MKEMHDEEEGEERPMGGGPSLGTWVHDLGDIMFHTHPIFISPGTDEV